MFLRPCYRKKHGKRHAYWALMESHRTERGPRQRVVAYLGQLDERGRLGVKEAAEGRGRSRQKRLFDDLQPRWVEVHACRVRVENCRDFGGPWLGLELLRGLGWQEFLGQTIPQGREKIPWSWMALVLVLCRLCNLAFLRQGQRRYIVGTPKSMLKQFPRGLLGQDWHSTPVTEIRALFP